ncbi:microtubule-actin cross-linking factor 1-like isoform X40 [Homarus americanus]|uniref:microtubule-actin cross-linking factor 1-like isoform X40 n=1 Tax=Homarus americanus TaxID=6706 RepID=UPI001C468E42|nr:microtubule-actin cross-linking factor 1-like isoform X40 [Homarus americanus]
MSTQHYYKDRLGFDPAEARANGTRDGHNTGADFKTFGGYEESLCKFKGIVYTLNIYQLIDERDAIQKKTFTKWVNKHLKKRYTCITVCNNCSDDSCCSPVRRAGKQVRDLFEDLRDGHNLLSLLEVLSGEHLPRERGRLRFHMLQNVQLTLDFLRYRKIKLVNIRCEDIVDGNPKLTLGLIWTIILHFQISDIMVGQAENLTAKEALLRWARNTTHKYPNVEVKNFTTSWRDGLAFVAIIHRNSEIIHSRSASRSGVSELGVTEPGGPEPGGSEPGGPEPGGSEPGGPESAPPDLVDWRNLRQRTPRERLETSFHVMEREYGVTRLLDPEDVDTPEPDEKSLITYVSQLYEIFPEPPSIHPLFNIEAQRKLEEYREMATTLIHWIREHISIMRDRHFPSNTVELKRMAQESTRFRQEEVPPRLRDKNSCQRLYREIQKLLDGTGFMEDELVPELHYNNVDSEWNKLMSLYQERDDALHDSLSGADRLQRLAEKVHREIKQTEITLEEVEIRIEDEARRVERLHPMDAKRNCDALDGELAQCEDTIKTLHTDVKILREGKYHEAPTLHKRVVKLEERYVSVRTLFENRLLIVLNNRSFTQQESYTTTKRIVVSESRLVETNEHFRFLQDCINWCKDKLKKLNDSEYGNDLAAVEKEYDSHQKEHKIIHQFHTNVDQCAAAENNFNGEEHTVYINLLSQLRKIYAELLSLSNKRVSDLHSLLDFLQAATQELIWLNEREEQELNRDWANKSLNITDVERYYEKLMGELEKREVQFSSVQDRGNSLVIGHHPASKTVEAYLAAMQTQWQWLLELTLCLETHLQHASHYHTFFTDIANAEQWVMAQDEKLNTTFSVTDFGLDDGEQLLREMQDIREELAQFNATADELINRAKTVVPLKQRRQTLRQPTTVTAICNYKKMDMSINKGERCTVHDNSNRVKWSVVSNSGNKGMVPGVCFTIPPPNQEAIDSAEKLKRQYERCIALWQKKQLRMRQNMIFATIKVVKSWDLAQFIAMGAEQRNAIRKALNEDAEKLLQEGDPNDPQLRRLKREIDEVNRLFDEFERRANEPKPGAVLVEQCNSLKEYLDMMEKMLIQRCLAGIPRDLDLLEQLVIEHKQFENDLSSHELEVESIQKNYQNLSRRTPAIQRTVESITQQWDRIWALSHVYIERMKCVEMVVTGIEEGSQVVSEIELKLAEHQDLPDELDDLEREHQELLNIQQVIHDHQALIDRLLEECRNVRTLVVKSRPSQKIHPDVDKLEEDVRKLRIRWENICSQIIERLRSCEAACELLTKYRNGHDIEKVELNDLENGLRSQKIEDLGPSEAELELERLRSMYMKIIEKKTSIEHVNTLGGRFIREAKIYDLRLSQYKASLEDVHPSLDASLSKRPRIQSGGDKVIQQLDKLNNQYQFIADETYDRIAKIYNRFQYEKNFTFQLEDLSPVSLEKTFRTELNLPDSRPDHSTPIIIDDDDSVYRARSEAQMMVTRGSIPSQRRSSATQLKESDSVDSHVATTTTHIGSSFQVTTTTSTRRMAAATAASEAAELHLVHPVTGEKISFHQAVQDGLVDLTSGTLTHPSTGENIPLSEAVERGYVSPILLQHLDTPCGIIDPATGRELTLLQATKRGLYSPEEGSFKDPTTGKLLTPEEASKIGFIILEKQAMIEKYRQCDATIVDMVDSVNEIERRLAEQEPVSENPNGLRNQINTVKAIKDELDEMFRPLGTCLDGVRQVVNQGGDVLSREELESLDQAATLLKQRYDHCVVQADTTHRRLTTAMEEFSKYEKEIALFQTWLKQATKTLLEKERLCSDLNKIKNHEQGCRDFLGDVIAHQADLRFITMATQKFLDESSLYLRTVNNFRTSLPERYPLLQADPDSMVRDAADDVTAEFKDLLARANKLVDKATSVGNKQRDYTEAIEKATRWLKDTEVKVVRILQEPVGADPKGVQDQLDKAKAINNDVVAQSRLFDNCRATSVSLLRALEGELDAREQEAIEHPPEELYERYAELADRLGYRCQELDTALVQCQGVQEGLDSLMSWLNSIDLQLKNASKPASLNRDRLDEQLREHRQLHADIMSHQASVVQINDSAEALLTSASNARVAKKIETKLRELNTKFEKVVEKSEYRGQHLEIVSTQLDAFTVSVEHFEEWYIEIVEIVESREVLSLDVESYARKIDEIARQRDSRSDDFDGMIRTGREMVTKKDVTDTAPVKDKIKNLEGQWKELNDTLDERARNGKERSEQLLAYEQLRDRCTQWLTTTENTLDNAQPVGLDQEVVKRQVDDLKPLLKEYREYGTTFDKLNELGNAYDALLRGERPESPSRRRSSVTPVKRPSITSPLKSPVRRVSQDARSPSPSHKLMGFNGSGPLSPIPGGYASRRTSQEGFHLDDMSPIQKELMQVNNRYDMIGMRLNDRQNELDVMKDELKKLADSIRSVTLALDKSERSMPREAVPTTKEEADKHNRQCKSILDDLLEKQLSLDSLKNQVTELIKKRPTAPGADTLQDQADILNDRYRELQGRLKDRLTFLEHTKDFLDSFDSLNNWLNSKDRMMSVLGPIASDPRMVQMQAQQVQVLRDEFQAQEPKLGDLNDAGDKIIGVCEPNSMAAKKINDKLDSINNKWTELIGQLDARDSALNAASDASTDFYDNYNKLHDTLLKLGDDFDEVNANGADSAQQIEAVNTLGKGLETARGSLIDLEGLGDHLISILSDPSSKNDIKSKITQLNKMFNNLEKKLGNRKSELEASLRDEEMFGQQCQDIQEWLADQVAHLKDQLLVSADRDTLSNQVGDFEPIYRDLMAKEHEVIMMINKGKEIVAKSSRKELNRQLSETLDAIKKEWDNVRKTAVDRRTRLQKCMDTCNKFHSLQDKFNPWLDKAEEKAHNLEPIAFTKKAIDKQIKEIQSFKNEVSRHSGEFENNRTGGEKFISCTDTDHDGVHDALAFMKERWDQLNAIVFARAQDLDDVAAKLVDFNDKARDLDHTLQRCGDRLASLDTLAGTGKDAKSLERMKALLEETDALGKQVDQVKNKGEDLCGAAEALGSDANHIQDEVERLADRYGDLKGKLEDRCHDLEEASQAVNQFGTLVKNMGQELTGLDDELDRMGSVGRDVKTVTGQIDQLQSFLTKVDHKNDEIEDAKAALEDLVSQGFTNTNNRTAEDQIKQLRRQLKKIQDRCDVRGKDLDTVLKKLENFYGKYNSVMDDINEADKDGESFKPVGADVDTIITQQEEFKHFKGDRVEALGKQVNECNKLGQGLIQSAASGVNTQALENDIDGMNELWNKLKEMIGDREKALDKGLMQSGKFQDALDSMLQWLGNFEEMMENQASISGEYSVVKAQAQEQKFLRKMLMDRQNEMQALLSMGRNLAADLEPSEKAAVEGQLDDLINRFDDANARSQERMEALEETLKVAKEFQNKLNPITEWLDRTEKKLKEMSTVPSDEEKIQRLLDEHDNLHDEILGQKPAFDDLTDVATALMSLIGDDEANALADKLQATTDRYGQLVEDSEVLGRLLQESKIGLRHLVLTYEDLLSWMDEMEARLSKYRILSVFVEKLLEQMDELTDLGEEVVSHEKQVAEVMDAGSHLMKHISSDEALQLKDKLDSIHRRYNDLSAKATDLHKAANEALPLVQQFHSAHERLGSWMLSVEGQLQSIDSSGQGPLEEEIERLAQEIQENRPLVEAVNLVGPQLCQISPGEGASNIETLVTRDNRRFEQICEQIQRRMERIHMSKQRSQEITQDIDELLGWFREVEGQMREAEPPSVDPEEIRVQLKEHKALNDDVASQKGRVRDVLSNAKKVLRESPHHEDTSELREKMDDLKETMESVSKLSSDRLSTLEQALPLAEHFFETHHELDDWLTAIESEAMVMDTPALRADKIIHQMERNKTFLQSIGDHKPLLDKLNKTGGALLKLVNDEDGSKIQELLESDNERYNALKYALRERGQALEDALQETSQFSDKLDGMLSSLAETADQVKNAEPISAHPEKIHEQVQENNGIIDDLDRKESAFVAVKAAAEEVINKASRNDPAVKDIKTKLDRLNKLWDMVQMATTQRGQSLEDALAMAEKFWEELQNVMTALKDLQETLKAQEPVAVEPQAIKQQREELSQIKNKIDQTKPEVEQVRQTGRDLMTLCGEADKPEVKKNIEDLDYAWDNVTALYAKREENLIDAMEKAMEFHDTLRNMLEFLEKAEVKFIAMGAVAGDIEAIKGQITQLHKFKDEVDPHMVKVEALNRSLRRQAQELKERTSPDQAAAIMEPLGEVNRRWDELLKGIVQRQRSLEYALLKLGQFQHALKELMVWIERTTKTVDDLKPVFGDPQVIEVELAKLKVTINDIQAHQSSVDTLNDAGRQLIEADKGSEDASNTHKKLTELNIKWSELQDKANGKQNDLESALREAQIFSAEIQDLLLWLGDIDAALSSSKPVGGLPETAKEQLLRFMEIYEDLEENRSKVENTLQQGQEYLKRSREGAATNLNHSLRTLKQRWESVMNRANDKKIKLEIALKEAKEFHDALQIFVDWLTEAENLLNAQQPVSRVLDIILQQIEEHNSFKKDVTAHREVMLSLDKKGTHLKYFSQKQDVILIKNLLVSVQHRWEKVVSKAAERTRALDLGFKEAKDFHDNWNELVTWLDDAESTLDDLAANVGNDPEKIKAQIAKHKEFQKALGAKQPSYDSTMKQGRGLQNKSPKSDEETLKQMMTDLKNKWNSVCQKSVDRQRKLEEALLFTGQFKDATQALLDWLKKVELGLVEDGPVHGDLDTVMALVEQHKAFCAELKNRSVQVESVRRTADELLIKASAEDAATIRSQITELVSSWEKVEVATEVRTRRLEEALQAAEQLHKVVHMLLDWLSDAEMKLRYAGPLPGGEEETRQQIAEHEAFLAELNQKEREKDDTIALAEEILAKAHPDGVATIKHWITIIQSRWEEVMAWARQRETRLADHLRSLRDLAGLLDELMRWLVQAENNLTVLEAEPLPDDIPAIEGLITDHKEFMDEMQKKEPDVLSICKPTKPRPSLSQQGKKRSRASIGRESVSPGRESSPEYDYPSRRSSRISPDRESSPGPKSRKSSRSSPAREITPTREYPRPWMYGARTTPPRESSPGADRERDWPLTHLRFATSTPTPSAAATAGGRKSSKASVREEPQIKNPQARALWEKWQHVGFMAWERMRRLHDKLSYLHELEKLKNFSWEEWRKRFMKFMNHKKSRVTDLFRKMDSDNDGAVPREDFIDGILKTKFPTSRLEMGTVADIFDRNQDGYIDYQEFIAALRPDWERKGPLTDAERIDDEVQKQVAKCTCRQKFRVHQVGEGKYRFGDSQKLRLVRILRSTVMVRVGGGWVALDEFLVKNDPCRVCPSIPELEQVGDLELHEHGCPLRGKTSPAGSCRSSSKGRTNVELREQFILAEGVSQSMTPFKSKPSPNSSVSSQSGTPAQQRSQSLPNSGPIMKVRERTAKSSAMGRTSFSAGTPDSSFSEEGGTSSFQGGKRKASAPVTSRSSYNTSGESQPGSRTGSRPPSRGPGSRPGSRPPSRAGSEVSLDSFDGGRTPMKRTPSFTGRTRAPSSQTSGVQRSSSLRKASAPVKSSTGTVNGTGTRAISVSSRSRSMTRTPSASSIPVAVASSSRLYSPTLSSRLKEAGIRTKIPVLVSPASDWERTNLSGSTSNLNVAGTPLRSRTSSTTSLNSNHSTSKIPTLRQKMSATHTTTTSKTSTTSRTRTPSGSSSTGGSTKIVRKSSAASDTPSGAARKTGIVEPRRKL